MPLTPEDAISVASAAASIGLNPNNLKAINPWDSSFNETRTSETLRMAVEAQNPGLANRLKAEANHVSSIPSLAFAAANTERQGFDPDQLSPELKQEWIQRNPELHQQRQVQAFNDQLQALEQAAADAERRGLLRQFGGNEGAVNRYLQQEKDKAEAKKANAALLQQQQREFDQRLARRQAEVRQAALDAMAAQAQGGLY